MARPKTTDATIQIRVSADLLAAMDKCRRHLTRSEYARASLLAQTKIDSANEDGSLPSNLAAFLGATKPGQGVDTQHESPPRPARPAGASSRGAARSPVPSARSSAKRAAFTAAMNKKP
jgi:hypothetical protein